MGLLILKTYPDQIFAAAQAIFNAIYLYAGKGSSFLFGSMAEKKDFVKVCRESLVEF